MKTATLPTAVGLDAGLLAAGLLAGGLLAGGLLAALEPALIGELADEGVPLAPELPEDEPAAVLLPEPAPDALGAAADCAALAGAEA